VIEQHYLDEALHQLRKLRTQADRALAQIDDAHLFAVLGPESNSIAVIMKHVAGNMRSRWTDFLTSDGEKPDRNRDSEFEMVEADTAAHVRARWDEGWRLVLDTIGALAPTDLERTVHIRGEPHTVLEAINRQLTHYAAHVGQIVFLARHYAGPRWQTLSIPKGKSKELDVSKSGSAYLVDQHARG
jgi:hypothetical protein